MKKLKMYAVMVIMAVMVTAGCFRVADDVSSIVVKAADVQEQQQRESAYSAVKGTYYGKIGVYPATLSLQENQQYSIVISNGMGGQTIAGLYSVCDGNLILKNGPLVEVLAFDGEHAYYESPDGENSYKFSSNPEDVLTGNFPTA